MTGFLKVKNDIFYAVLNIKEGGKYKQKWISTKLKIKGNKWKATEFLNKALGEYKEKKLSKDTNDILFSDYLIQWLDKKKNKVEIITFESYKTQVKKHICPYFVKKASNYLK